MTQQKNGLIKQDRSNSVMSVMNKNSDRSFSAYNQSISGLFVGSYNVNLSKSPPKRRNL